MANTQEKKLDSIFALIPFFYFCYSILDSYCFFLGFIVYFILISSLISVKDGIKTICVQIISHSCKIEEKTTLF